MLTTTDSLVPEGALLEINGRRKEQYKRFFRRFVLLTLISSVVPLLLVGWGINIHYTGFARSRMTDNFRNEVNHHLKIIELFFKEHSSKLQLVARTHTKAYLANPSNLNKVFEMINHDYASLTDLGVIDHTGRHLAYIGPYDLMDKNYSQTFWFREVMDKGLFISDMFMGFRQEPHFIMAVASWENGQPWILRATIDTEAFRSLVENVRIGRTGEVYLLNTQGIYQTSPRFDGYIMEKARLPLVPVHDGIQVRVVDRPDSASAKASPRQIISSAWLKEPRWTLFVTQNYEEAFQAVNHANRAVLVFLHISALSILVVAVLVNKHMLTLIRRRDEQNDQLNRQLMQTSKLASIGELSAGVAHEINNPLAIMLTEKQILLDASQQLPDIDPSFRMQFNDSMAQMDIQIQRCKRITHNLLRFSRRTHSVMETVHLNAFIQEVVELMEREAKANGIRFSTQLDPKLPALVSDPSQLQQVFLNLITNAIDAHEGKPYGRIDIATSMAEDNQAVHLCISDTGCGIPRENLEKIFDPFFTTKPVGKGTGLGLSICYSIVERLGGRIAVQSAPGKGTRFDIFLPLRPPAALMQKA
ncbi:MAG: sensor histidine kinase [Desulfobacteraceae bacterium]|nr:MAG: sensor histidine kinase [Desulfobacteraceae bacterium]